MKKSLELGGAALVLVAAIIFGILYVNPHLQTAGNRAPVQKATSGQSVPAQQTVSPQAAGKTFADVAVATSTITIRDCKPTRTVTKINHSQLVTFVNKDAVSHVISFAPTMQYLVPAHASKDAYFVQWTQPGVRRYDCDSHTNVGQIYVEK